MDLHREPPAETACCHLCKKWAKAAAAEEQGFKSFAKTKGLEERPAVPNIPYVPQPEDVPEPLRDLTRETVQALRPLDIDVGPYERPRDGYRAHTCMIRFAWAAKGVSSKIKALRSKRERKKAKRAYDFLVEADGSAYYDFVERHEKFLAEYPEAKEKKRKRPWRFLEEPALENAVWPHLYWKRSMCESVARFTDERRLRRTGRKKARFWRRAETTDAKAAAAGRDDRESSEEDGDDEHASENEIEEDMVDVGTDFIEEGRHSGKANFMAKVHSRVIGYGTDYELMQYMYDLNMWSAIGGGKNAVRGTPLRAP